MATRHACCVQVREFVRARNEFVKRQVGQHDARRGTPSSHAASAQLHLPLGLLVQCPLQRNAPVLVSQSRVPVVHLNFMRCAPALLQLEVSSAAACPAYWPPNNLQTPATHTHVRRTHATSSHTRRMAPTRTRHLSGHPAVAVAVNYPKRCTRVLSAHF